jgi:hypothetical protein
LELDAPADIVVGPVARVPADLPERPDLLVIGSGLPGHARYPVVIVPGPE